MSQGFYKKDANHIIFSEDIVNGPGYLLSVDNRNDHTYPVDGWIWTTDIDDAMVRFTKEVVQYPPFQRIFI